MAREDQYAEDCATGTKGVALVMPFFELHSVAQTFHGRLSRELQAYGDLLINLKSRPGAVLGVEVKAENEYTGNLFLETWSNRARYKRGWMDATRADVIVYVFLDAQRAFLLWMPDLKEWAFQKGHIYRYSELRVWHPQLNDAWGRPVPLQVLRRDVGLLELDTRPESYGPAQQSAVDEWLGSAYPAWRENRP